MSQSLLYQGFVSTSSEYTSAPIAVSIPSLSGLRFNLTTIVTAATSLAASQSLLYQGFVSTEDCAEYVVDDDVSIPSLSGLRFNLVSVRRSMSRRHMLSQSLLYQGFVSTPVLRCSAAPLPGLNPFFIRASFQHGWPAKRAKR